MDLKYYLSSPRIMAIILYVILIFVMLVSSAQAYSYTINENKEISFNKFYVNVTTDYPVQTLKDYINSSKSSNIVIDSWGKTGNYFWAYGHLKDYSIWKNKLFNPWWNASYYQTQIQVNNTGNASVLTDFQVRVNITYNSTTMDSNFTSFHLINKTSNTEMVGRFWTNRSNTVNGSYAEMWLNLTSIPASSWDNTTFALAHRNVSETDSSNGNGTSPLFDDFFGTSIDSSKWLSIAGTPSVSGGVVTIPTSGSTDLQSIMTFGTNYIVQIRMSVSNTATDAIYGFSNCDSSDAGICTIAGAYNSYVGAATSTGSMNRKGTYADENHVDTGYDFTGYHVYEFKRNGTSSVDMYVGGLSIYSNSLSVPVINVPVGFWASGIDILVDYVFVRKTTGFVDPTAQLGETESYQQINISNWQNNYTNNQSLTFTINKNTSQVVNFNVSTNIPSDIYSWFVNSSNQSNNFNNFSYNFSTNATVFINATVFNASYNNYDNKNWTVTYIYTPDAPPPSANYSVSGYVKIEDGTPLEDATISYSGGSNLSSITGFYNITGILNGTYLFTASRGGYNSLSKNITIDGANLVNQNFTLIVSSNNTEILAAISSMNASLRVYVNEQSSSSGAIGFIGGIVGGALVIGVLRRKRA